MRTIRITLSIPGENNTAPSTEFSTEAFVEDNNDDAARLAGVDAAMALNEFVKGFGSADIVRNSDDDED